MGKVRSSSGTQLDFQTILGDLRAAARLGTEEALDLALEPLGEWEDFRANRRLPASAVRERLVPLGVVLAAPTVPLGYLRGLAEEPLAGARAIAAAALLRRYLAGEKNALAPLRRLAADRREEVRVAMLAALPPKGEMPAERLLAFLRALLSAKRFAPEAAALTAFVLLPSLAESAPKEACALAKTVARDERPTIGKALGDALRECATTGAAKEVLALLKNLAAQNALPVETAARALRGGWHPPLIQERLALLKALETKTGGTRALRRTRTELENLVPIRKIHHACCSYSPR